MWPFGSDNSKDITNELPENLQEFYKEKNPTKHKLEQNFKDEKVQKVLAKAGQGYTHTFEQYKRDYLAQKASAINCAELQAAVLKCYDGWLFLGIDNCSAQIKTAAKCNEIQERAFHRLRYNECYSERQCGAIRYVVDQLFTKNFGQLGENVNEELQATFERELDAVFDKVWK